MALTPGLVPNLRLDQNQDLAAPDEGMDVIVEMADESTDLPEMDVDGNILRIEHPDGSISISLDGKPLGAGANKGKDTSWYANLAEDLEEQELSRISAELLRGIDSDLESRKEWIEDRAIGLRLLGLKIEVPGLQGAADGAPIEGMSKVRHPLLLEAVLRHQANARSELLPVDGPAKVRDDSNYSQPDSDWLADAFEKDLNHYLTVTAKEYYPDTDKMLFMQGFGGSGFKKVYFCPLRNRPVSESVDADDLIVNNEATDLDNARRITHRIFMRPSVVKRMQLIGVYRDVVLSQVTPKNADPVQLESSAIEGVTINSNYAEDRDREIYECYCELNIKGHEHMMDGAPTGLEVPYRVTIDVSSKQILSIVRNYKEDDQLFPTAKKCFVHYVYIPGLGFYGIGLLQILGNATNAVTAGWRELLDAGMYANFPGFLYAKAGGRQNSNIFRVPPGGGAQIDTGNMPINQAVMPLPYKEPSGALMSLIENIGQYAQRLGGTADVPVGEGRQDAPVGTTVALIEQATKILSSVHKRMHAAQAEELQMIAEVFREHPESFWQRNLKPAAEWDEAIFLKALDDIDLIPQSDPNTASHMQRMMKVSALVQMAQQAPQLYDLMAVNREALRALGWENADQFLSMQPPQPDPMAQAKQSDAQAKMIQAQAKMLEAQTKSGGTPAPVDQAKMVDAQVKMAEVQQQAQDSQLDAINRKRDRESRERLAAIKLAEEIASDPQSLNIINQLINPGMLQRLEGNEPPFNGTPNAPIQ